MEFLKSTNILKLSDIFRWIFSCALIYMVYTETGIWTSGLVFLLIVEKELLVVLGRLDIESQKLNDELSKGYFKNKK